MRRKRGQLLPFEQQILDVIGDGEMHGTEIGKQLGLNRQWGYGALYKALRRLTEMGCVTRRWEAQEEAERHKRPPRRLYRRVGGANG